MMMSATTFLSAPSSGRGASRLICGLPSLHDRREKQARQAAVRARRLVRLDALGRNRMNVAGRHGDFGQERLVGHAEIAFGIIAGNEALVTPEEMHAFPRELLLEFAAHELKQPARRRAAGERD